jgi:outer membrane receptor for ferrienterochelin and colicins
MILKISKAFLLLLCLTVSSQMAIAQGTLTGTVTDVSSGERLMGASILLQLNESGFSRGTNTGIDGQFSFTNLSAGTYTARVSYVGYVDVRLTDIQITNGNVTTLNIEMTPGVSLNPVVVSASKAAEKVTEAPASIQVVTPRDIQNISSVSPAEYVKGLTAVDIAQQGVISQTAVTRGFNNIFSGSLLVLTDNRIAHVPSLRANILHFIPATNDDIESIELVLGPGAALYGPNTNSGVMHMITKSPLTSTGTDVSVTVGEQSLMKAQFRTAHSINDRFAIKVSGQFLQAKEYQLPDNNTYRAQELAARQAYLNRPANMQDSGVASRIGVRDYDIEKLGIDARIDYRLTDDFTMIVNTGFNRSSNIDLTGLGAGQAVNWTYSYAQMRFLYKNWFAQAFVNNSNSGDTYIIPTGLPIVDKSFLTVAQIQHTADLGQFNFVYGADFLQTTPRTEGSINGRYENEDVYNEVGGYLQAKWSMSDKVDLLGSFRVDKHSKLNDPVFSPRAALVVRPIQNQNFRFTYNRSFSTPSSNNLFLDLLAAQIPIGGFYNLSLRAQGVPGSGFTFERDANGRPLWVSNLAPAGAPPFALNTQDPATWALMRGALQALFASNPQLAPLAPAMAQAPVPGSANPAGGNYSTIGMGLASLNTGTGGFDPVTDVTDISAIQPTTYNTFEVGYKGIIDNKLLLSVDVYYTKAQNFVGPLLVETPNVFVSGANATTYLTQYLTNVFVSQGMNPQQAAGQAAFIAGQVGPGLGGLPLGVVTPREAFDRNAVILTYRNFGEIEYWGVDTGFEYLMNNQFRLMGNYSYVSEEKWLNLDGNPDFNIFLNAPQNKYMIGLGYDNRDLGFDITTRFRYVKGFPISSGIYSTLNTNTGVYERLDDYSSLDLNAGYNVQSIPGLRVSMMVTNLLNSDQVQFAGTPAIQRMGLFTVGYSF